MAFVTDAGASLMTALHRAFAREFRHTDAHHFLCLLERGKSREQAYKEYRRSISELYAFANAAGIDEETPQEIAKKMLEGMFKTHAFHDTVEINGRCYNKKATNPIRHPIAPSDRGYYNVDCTTDLSGLSPAEIAEMVVQVNNHSTNGFLQQIRRRISILERPLVTASEDGKSYIYANFNAKYAQYAITVLRTHYNFCAAYKSGGKSMTPAQRLGIADKQYKWEDIIYFS